jgi:hypothetical protein
VTAPTDSGLPAYLEEEEEPQRWPWQLRFFLAAAVVLVIEIVVIGLANIGVI